MKLLNWITPDAGAVRVGVATDAGVIDCSAIGFPALSMETLIAQPEAFHSLQRAIDHAVADPAAHALRLLDETTLRFAPALTHPGKIICVGLNYRRHAAESGLPVPSTPVLFSKFNNSLAAHREAIPLPPTAHQYDYEVELAVVLGRRARNVSVEEALGCIFGYCTANDLSARDLQTRTSQWLLGKTLDKFLPLGPYLVTADEVRDPQNLSLKCWVNGELRQNSNTADMIFSVAEIVSYISQHFTLEPGDVICTGTPEGVILGMAEKVWLRAGDEVTVEVEGLGRLTNVMA
ncbi:fumarylacetoacetate hydrolase family protein [Caldilinea sp.]|jgi:2-keto-4-pentenoate hydratase/2-oxohepta-3-ene-1,7-dioic acid hydratase in catechol pathway|uniref:fumarylacetoacetate hydrolase family protein n=1 Tax=Caldilinea sp. TaxID=2293560 RepID=UPI00261BF169|nr:fumarylacetoacetate hydrolase family protein [uncultured Caldilinea sp.]